MSIAIIGSGMAGLLAAKALEDKGIKNFEIYDKSPGKGASGAVGLHYLHNRCGLPLKTERIQNVVIGDSKWKPPSVAYNDKIWGMMEHPDSNSLEQLVATNEIYNFGKAYKMLYEIYSDRIMESEIKGLSGMKRLANAHDYVLTTIPAPIWMGELHGVSFPKKEIKVSQKLPNNIEIPEWIDHFSLYNISEDDGWYRCSRVFGVVFTEYPKTADIENTMTAYKIRGATIPESAKRKIPNNIYMVGRWGTWKRSYLVHQAYQDIMDITVF